MRVKRGMGVGLLLSAAWVVSAAAWVFSVGAKEECSAAIGSVNTGRSTLSVCNTIAWFNVYVAANSAAALVTFVVRTKGQASTSAAPYIVWVFGGGLAFFLLPMLSLGFNLP